MSWATSASSTSSSPLALRSGFLGGSIGIPPASLPAAVRQNRRGRFRSPLRAIGFRDVLSFLSFLSFCGGGPGGDAKRRPLRRHYSPLTRPGTPPAKRQERQERQNVIPPLPA